MAPVELPLGCTGLYEISRGAKRRQDRFAVLARDAAHGRGLG